VYSGRNGSVICAGYGEESEENEGDVEVLVAAVRIHRLGTPLRRIYIAART